MKNIIPLLFPAFLCIVCFFYFDYLPFGRASNTDSQFLESLGKNMEQPAAAKLLKAAAEQLEKHISVDANIRLKLTFCGSDYSGSGFYIEKRNDTQLNNDFVDRLFRMEIRFHPSIADSSLNESNTMKVVCDGDSVWKYSIIEGENKFQRFEIGKISEAISKSERAGELNILSKLPSLGSLGGTIREIQNVYDFNTGVVENVELGSSEFPALKIRTTMKKEYVDRMLATAGTRKEDIRRAEKQIPVGIAVYLGQDDYFPYRIEYFSGPIGSIAWEEPSTQQDFYKVRLNEMNISTDRFQNTPPEGMSSKDETDAYIDSLNL